MRKILLILLILSMKGVDGEPPSKHEPTYEIIERIEKVLKELDTGASSQLNVELAIQDDLSKLHKIGKEKALYIIGVIKDKEKHPYLRIILSKIISIIDKKRIKDELLSIFNDYDDDPRVRAEAGWILGRNSLIDSKLLLNVLKREKNKYLQAEIIRVFDYIGDKRAISALVKILKDENEDTKIRTMAAIALGEIGRRTGEKGMIAPLGEVLKKMDKPDVYVGAINALGRLKDKQAIKYLVKEFKVKRNILAAKALGSLWKEGLQVNIILNTLIEGLNTNDELTKMVIAKILGEMKDKRAIEELKKALTDLKEENRDIILWALKELEGKDYPEYPLQKEEKTKEMLLPEETKLVYKVAEPDCEIGDAVFYNGRTHSDVKGTITFPLAAIYICSQSKIKRVSLSLFTPPYSIPIKNSDLKHTILIANGYTSQKETEALRSLPFKSPLFAYLGASCSPNLTLEKRKWIILSAYEQMLLYPKYATGNPEFGEDYRDIKNPGRSFRDDGLVEYCYEQVYQGKDSKGALCDNRGFFSEEEEKKCWFIQASRKDIFSALELMERMEKAKGEAPEIEYIYIPNRAREGEDISIHAKLKDDSSGIDRAEFYYKRKDDPTPILFTYCDTDGDIDRKYSVAYIVPPGSSEESKLYILVFDKAGNMLDFEKPIKVAKDNEPPNIYKIFFKTHKGITKIGIVFSENMDANSINQNSIIITGPSPVLDKIIEYDQKRKMAIVVLRKLLHKKPYTIRIVGGIQGVMDISGNPLASDYISKFGVERELWLLIKTFIIFAAIFIALVILTGICAYIYIYYCLEISKG